MILGISYDLLRWEERNLIEEARKLDYKVVPLYTKDISFLSGEDVAYQDVEAIIQRNTSHSRALSTSILFETSGFKVFNDSLSLARCENKLQTTFLLRSRGIPVPNTAIAFSRDKAIEMASKLGYPVVIKPIEGSWGRMVARAQDEDSLRSLIEYQEFTSLQYKTIYYLQEYVNKPNRDIRIFAIGDEVPVGIYRENDKNWKTNTALGAVAKPLKIDEELKELTLKVKEIIGGFFLGVDVFEDKERGYLIGEVNGVPEFKNTVRVNQFNVSNFLLNKLNEVIRK
ncbi:lysine biosynthesis protein LysX [Metallosphaera hakonensis]|uniref:Lysine biosynthesis protein LysX n=1 Tax=Metallosphaera hakonensis JCM 8857 = DSM 7519 TaxID=1293036 RepID=A0A2U9ITF2_9CREN|nr:lysine biosynthesis protein LysX [Metallosphaera hakonensis]AWR99329.1 lysine biosynthesis protein LysX [Metallosphaera hakonensis JCM 8857 = DSM 7519]